jgi:thiazole/oxazole-forming peptide maturase SagD family component
MSAVAALERGAGIDANVRALLDRMVSPVCGFDKSLAFSLRDGVMPKLQVVVGQMVAVHRLLAFEHPLSYHIGGYGVYAEEALIRALGETLERYTHMALVSYLGERIVFRTYDEMRALGLRAFGPEAVRPFTAEQFAQPGFPFRSWRDEDRVSWVRGFDPADGADVYVPAQACVVGYVPRHPDGEPWLTAAVTTGSAAHTRLPRALRSALLELIEIDTTMGYWYSDARLPRIASGHRTRAIDALLARDLPPRGVTYSFHYLRNPDLGAHVVTAVARSPEGQIPARGVGVGCDLDLERAMYKAYLEASAIAHLALISVLLSGTIEDIPRDDLGSFGDLDKNVAYYGLPENSPIVDARFPLQPQIAADDLPDYRTGSVDDDVAYVLGQFAITGKRLALFDFTTPDVKDLAFVVARAWSPDTLPLCLPSFPSLGHPRYAAYGRAGYAHPHPYP